MNHPSIMIWGYINEGVGEGEGVGQIEGLGLRNCGAVARIGEI